jgi:hypothetical protein
MICSTLHYEQVLWYGTAWWPAWAAAGSPTIVQTYDLHEQVLVCLWNGTAWWPDWAAAGSPTTVYSAGTNLWLYEQVLACQWNWTAWWPAWAVAGSPTIVQTYDLYEQVLACQWNWTAWWPAWAAAGPPTTVYSAGTKGMTFMSRYWRACGMVQCDDRHKMLWGHQL